MCMQCKPTAGQCVLAIQPRSPRELQPAGFVFGCFRLFLQTIERGRLGLVACLSAVMAAMASMAASMRVGATNDVLSGAVGLGVAQWRASFCNPHAGRLQKQQIAAVAKHGAEDHHGRAAATAARAAFSDVIVEEQQYQVDADATMEVDAAAEAEVRENGLQRMRRTKLVCTIGPACSTYEQLELLASRGMNVARINMCHGTREWHRNIIRAIRRINADKGYSVAVMMDTEGSEIHMGDLGGSASAKAEDGEEWVFTVRKADVLPKRTLHVNYDGFAEDVTLGDELVVDGGMVRFEVLEKIGPDVHCRCIDPGLLLPRANLTFWRHGQLLRGRSAMLPTICSKASFDWIDIDFGIAQGVDFIAISFVKSADVIMHLRSYIEARSVDGSIGIIAKIESAESLKELSHIIQASDGAMVARGDLGAQIPLEQVPAVQQEVVQLCRKLNKPVIVASQMLESMIEYPMPTRAEVADISQSVRQGADALMLSGESAMGQFPEKALGVLCTASSRIEQWCRETKDSETLCLPALSNALVDQISEQVCDSAVQMANKLEADAIFVYTRGGAMASLVSRNRPSCPIFVFTNSITVRRKLSIQWGVLPFRLEFSEDMESNIGRTFGLLKEKGTMKCGDLVVVVSDIARSDITQSVQVRRI